MKRSTKLPNGVTSDWQLAVHCAKTIKNFRGVMSQSDFPIAFEDLRPGESVILNLDPNYKNGGTHWVAVRASSSAPVVYYHDSFGAPPPQIVADTVKSVGYGLVYSNREYQKITEKNCGKRAASFLKKMEDAAAQGKEIEKFKEIA